MRDEIRFAGFGGQGIIRSGLILSMAASIYGEKNAVQTQSYGPESRGGSCRSEVVIADEEIDFPKVDKPNIIVIMSREAYQKYIDSGSSDAIILVDPDMVPTRNDPQGVRIFDIPSTRTAETLGKKIVANVVMLGALTSITKLVPPESMKKAILRNIPKGTESLNMKAFKSGYKIGQKLTMSRT